MSSVILSTWVITLSTLSRYLPGVENVYFIILVVGSGVVMSVKCSLSSDATPGHREPCAETNARVGIKFASQNVIDVSTVVGLSYVLFEYVSIRNLQ